MKPLSRLLVLFYDGCWEHVRLGDAWDVSYVSLHESYGLVVSVCLEPQATVPCSENVVRAVESYVRQGVLLQCLQFVYHFVCLVGSIFRNTMYQFISFSLKTSGRATNY